MDSEKQNISINNNEQQVVNNTVNIEQNNNLNINNNPNNYFHESKKFNYKYIIIGIVILVLIITVFLVYKNTKTYDSGRVNDLNEIKKNKILKFKINDKEYSIGNKLSELKDFSYIKTFNELDPDSVLISPFSIGNDNDFLGLIYCSSKDSCKYEDAILIKASFYETSDVVINNNVKFGTYYDDIVEEYGKPDGTYYQDETMYVWSFGNDIGDAYMVLGFDSSGIFSMNDVDDIRLGVWWYEGEAEETIVKEDKDEKEDIN